MIKWVLIIAAILIILAAVITVVMYVKCFYSPLAEQGDPYKIPNNPQFAPYRQRIARMIFDFSRVEYEPVETVSFDGLKLAGKFYRGRADMPVVIGFHGYRSMSLHDYCGEGMHMVEKGYNLILVDQRGCEKSEGHAITFGVNERFDCLRWIDFVRKHFGEDREIFLSGISMGATTVLLAAGLDLPDNVKGIMADCGFTSGSEIIKKVAKDRRLASWLFYPFARLGAKILGHFDLEACNAVDAVKKTKVPILITHGDDDRFVPYEMGQRLYEANPEMIRFETYTDAGHGISFLIDEERYKKMTEEFMNKCRK